MTPLDFVLAAAAALLAASVAAEPASATGRWTVSAVRNQPDMAITAPGTTAAC